MNYKFSGHETFPCRYTWLPKSYTAIKNDAKAFVNEEDAMVQLGIGKNMVRAARFWVQAAKIAEPVKSGGLTITDFGQTLLDPIDGLDPFLEDIQTLWLIHWKLSTQFDEPLFAWNFLLFHWNHLEITKTEVLREFAKNAEKLERRLSRITLEQHFDVFLHTYLPTKSRKGSIQEDNLDCPLIELKLIKRVGERTVNDGGNKEPIYSFRYEEKPDISSNLFIYCLDEFWNTYFPNEEEMGFREIAFGIGSPGQVFKIPEWDLRIRMEGIEKDSGGIFEYIESAAIPRVRRNKETQKNLLTEIYKPESLYATN